MDYELSARARGHLEAILDYRRRNAGIASAARLRIGLTAAFEQIGAHPRIGRSRPGLTTRPDRFWFTQGYWIIYRLRAGKSPLIVAIIDARRDIARLLR